MTGREQAHDTARDRVGAPGRAESDQANGRCSSCNERTADYHFFAPRTGGFEWPPTVCTHCAAREEWLLVRARLRMAPFLDAGIVGELELAFQAQLAHSPRSGLQYAIHVADTLAYFVIGAPIEAGCVPHAVQQESEAGGEPSS
jgi:hypothetical protein